MATFDASVFIRGFRGAAPYIHAHRGKTFVVYFGGEIIQSERFPTLLHDFALLSSLGIRLVLVHGIRTQIDSRLENRALKAQYHQGLRITDLEALECVKEAAGTARVEIEALLSMGLPNSPMAGAHIRVTSGNFVTAKPLGVRDGIDFQQTGEVRRIDSEGIQSALNQGDVVLLSAVGYSPTGEIFNLRSESVAEATAIALGADKLILLGRDDCCDSQTGQVIRQLTTEEAERLLEEKGAIPAGMVSDFRAAIHACRQGVARAHSLNAEIEGALLLELFTRDGVGTLISRMPFESTRAAQTCDIPGILDLVVPLEQQGILIERSRERLEEDIQDYQVVERDQTVIGCAALHGESGAQLGELACLVLHPDYQGEGRGEALLQTIESLAIQRGFSGLYVLTTQTTHWFRERGFEPADLEALPAARQKTYNRSRNSKILIKSL